jgi:hypothetical protein
MHSQNWRYGVIKLVKKRLFDNNIHLYLIPQSKNKNQKNAQTWDNEQICHWLTAVGLGEYVQVFRGMFGKLGITGNESSAFSAVSLFLLVRERGGPRFKFNFYFLGGGPNLFIIPVHLVDAFGI